MPRSFFLHAPEDASVLFPGRMRSIIPSAGAPDPLAAISPDLLTHWALDQTSGNNATVGGYSGVALAGPLVYENDQNGVANGATTFSGTQGLDVYSVGHEAAFPKSEGSVTCWAKVSGTGVWTDGVARNMWRFAVSGTDNFQFFKQTVNNTVRVIVRSTGSGSAAEVAIGSAPLVLDAGWHLFGASWSDAGNVLRYFYDGAQVGTDISWPTGIIGTFLSNFMVLGCERASPVSLPWSGAMSDFRLFSRPLTIAEHAIVFAQGY